MNPRLLIWLRRFRPRYGSRFRFHRALAEACSGLAHSVTIQDPSYQASLIDGFTGRGWFVLPLAFLMLIAGMLGATLLLLMVGASVESFLLAVPFLFIGTMWLALRVTRRLGYRSYRGPGARLAAAAALDAIKRGQRAGVIGVDVMQCDDDVWQDVVGEALARADIAIIDVSDVTDNLRWEIRQALDILPRERVIFAREEGRDDGIESERSEAGALSAIDDGLEAYGRRVQVIGYPAKQSRPGPGRRTQIRDVATRLRVVIAEALVTERDRHSAAVRQLPS